jgi:hypothetical protein
MSMSTNLAGRIRNTSLPLSNALLPVFEAVVNSIQACEDIGGIGNIKVSILRDKSQLELPGESGPAARPKISGFRIADDGIGFNDANFRSFKTLDSDHKVERGCRGVGRLMWLKAFRGVDVESVFEQDGQNKLRKFHFGRKGVLAERTEATSVPRQTFVTLLDFEEKYRSRTLKSGDAIANALLEHCLWFFLSPKVPPNIEVIDGADSVCVNDLFKKSLVSKPVTEERILKDCSVSIQHLRRTCGSQHQALYSAGNRIVRADKMQLPSLQTQSGDAVWYSCCVSSAFLDEAVRSDRTALDISEEPDPLYADTEISMKDLKSLVESAAKLHLQDLIDDSRKLAKERLEHFVSSKGPRYRPILKRIKEPELVVSAGASDQDIDLALHRELYDLEREVLETGHDLRKQGQYLRQDEYRTKLKAYISSVTALKQSDLAGYVANRHVVIELFEQALAKNDTDDYCLEEVIHDIIFPLRCTSDDAAYDTANLWLIDERLAFHHFLASDVPLRSMPITDSNSGTEPDLVAIRLFDNRLLCAEKAPLASLTIIELKRPMRTAAAAGEKSDPVEQVIGYLSRIREGGVKTAQGRPIPNAGTIPGYCYIVCDITTRMKQRFLIHDLKETDDGMGYYRHHVVLNAYIEVISFDKLLESAKQRHRAFFDKLGLPTA